MHCIYCWVGQFRLICLWFYLIFHSGRDFIAPCKCKGTSKYVHRECLDHWRAVRVWVPISIFNSIDRSISYDNHINTSYASCPGFMHKLLSPSGANAPGLPGNWSWQVRSVARRFYWLEVCLKGSSSLERFPMLSKKHFLC